MFIKNYYLYIHGLSHFRKTNLLRLLFLTVFFISQNSFAQTDETENESSSNMGIRKLSDEIVVAPRPVEVGPGGDIKQEGKHRTKAESLFEWHAHVFWESRYVTEGRDNLSGNSLISASSEFALDEFSVVPWIAASPDEDYTEINLNVVYGTTLTEDVVVYAGYNRVHSRDSGINANDNEISLDLAYKWVKHFQILASIYHSFDADGSFMEMAVKFRRALNSKIHYGARGVLGINAGYIPDGHNGFNHVQLRASIAYHPLTQLDIYAYTAYTQAINRDAIQYAGDELLGDFTWVGVGSSYRF